MKLTNFGGRARASLKLLAALTVFNIPAAFAQDPDFFLDFNTDPTDQLEIISNSDTTEWRSSGGVDDSGYFSLTDNVNGARAAVIFEDPTGGKPIEGMVFSVDCRIGGGTDRPADGFSLNVVRPDDPLLADPRGSGYAGTTDIGAGESNLPEEGSQTGLGIGFDAWVSGGQDIVGISVRVDGEMVEQVAAGTLNGEPDDITTLQTGPQSDDPDDPTKELTWQPFEAELTPSGQLTVKWKGETLIDALEVNYFPGPAQIVFGGRTGGANQNHHFDNLSLTILAAEKAVVSGLNFTREDVVFRITDGEDSTLDADTLTLMIDGAAVSPEVTKDGLVTTISYTPDPPFEVASIHPYVLAAKDTAGNDIGRSGTLQLPVPIFPFEPLVGAEGDDGFFGTRYIWGGIEDGEIGSSDKAIEVIQAVANGTWDGNSFDALHQTINFTGGGFFGDDDVYPDEVTSSEDWTGDDFVQYSRGYLRFAEAGLFTFGVHSDDGFGLRVLGGPEFISSDGLGQIDRGDPSTLVFNGPTGDADTRGVLNVESPGTYLVEFFWWERAGGDNGELFVSKGAISGGDLDEAASWSLVGQSETVAFNIPGVDDSGWTITTSEPGGDEIGDIAGAIADLEGATMVTEGADVFNINDPDSGGPGTFADDSAFPGNTDGDDDDWGVRATATLVIPATGEYQLGFRGDDGGQLTVAGQSFKEIVTSAVPDSAEIVDGRLIADVPTGNSNTVGSIDLEAGTYDIEYIGFERAGGAYFEVFGIGSGGPSNVLLARDGAGSGLLEPALALVAPPAVRLPVVDFAREGENVRIDFEALDVAAEHVLQSSPNLMNFTDVAGATVTPVEGNVLSIVGASLDPNMAYYRVRQLPPPAILEDGFEDGDLGWTVDAGVWELGTPAGSLSSALTGDNVFATSLQDGYPAGSNTGLRSPLLDLVGATAPRLSFFYNQSMGEEEGVRLDFLDESGSPIFASDIIFTGNSGGWVEFNRPIPSEAREQMMFIEFRLLTDGDESNDGFGFAIDDVVVK